MLVSKQFKKDMASVFHDLSLVDKLLPVWIILAMILGILLSVYVPQSREAFDRAKVVGVSIPLAIGLIVMMIPPLCKAECEHFFKFFSKTTYLKPILISLALNWIVGPFLINEIIMIGLARCIAMVLLWNDIARGDNTLCAVIVLINSLLQVVLYAPCQIFFCYVITGDYNPSVTNAGFGVLIRFASAYTIGLPTYEKKMIRFISPWALIGLLYTIIVIFIDKGNDFLKEIGYALRCFVPLVAYFTIMWFGTFFFLRWISYSSKLGVLRKVSKKSATSGVCESEASAGEDTKLLCGCEEKMSTHPNKWISECTANYSETITQTFTASSNNFELSLAVAISLYGSGSKEAIAATFGPLLEVPILLILAFVARYFRVRFIWSDIEEEYLLTDEESTESTELSYR
ncbi:sodium bile acid symporter family-domain-containing protein [Scheffersomyces xylosifermentans]|uniref:sodium bile acid symporter family-domain-containing protein n=1 Tax=Scheffersomyces xylosifermentans TaxID=1304137 RepID=UPI00315CBD64